VTSGSSVTSFFSCAVEYSTFYQTYFNALTSCQVVNPQSRVLTILSPLPEINSMEEVKLIKKYEAIDCPIAKQISLM